MRHEPEFYDGKAEFWLEPEFLANLSFAPNAQKNPCSNYIRIFQMVGSVADEDPRLADMDVVVGIEV